MDQITKKVAAVALDERSDDELKVLKRTLQTCVTVTKVEKKKRLREKIQNLKIEMKQQAKNHAHEKLKLENEIKRLHEEVTYYKCQLWKSPAKFPRNPPKTKIADDNDLKPYGCCKCNKSFEDFDCLKHHQDIECDKSVKYDCIHCNLSFYHKDDYNEHNKTVHDGTVFNVEKFTEEYKFFSKKYNRRKRTNEEYNFECQKSDAKAFGEQISEQKKVKNEIVDLDQTVKRLQNTLRISKNADKAFSFSPKGQVKKQVIAQTAAHVEADQSKMSLRDVPYTVMLCKDLKMMMKSTTVSKLKLLERKPTIELISESKRIELREQFVSLLENHGCKDFTCSVVTFRDHVRHAICCTNGQCSWYICQRIYAKNHHFKYCTDNSRCLFCQPFANFNEAKMMSLITNLEKGCLLNTMNRYNIGPSSRDTIVNMTARLAVNFGLVGEIVNCDEDEVPDLVIDESEEIIDVEKVDPKDEAPIYDVVKIKNTETTKVEEMSNSVSENAAVDDNKEVENSEIPGLVEITEDVLRNLSLSSDDEGMLREWEMIDVDSDGAVASDQKSAPVNVEPVKPATESNVSVAKPNEKQKEGQTVEDIKELIADAMTKTSKLQPAEIQEMISKLHNQPNITQFMEYKNKTHAELWYDCASRLTVMIQGIVEFAKMIPNFMKLSQDDQIILLKTSAFALSIVRMSRYFDLISGQLLVPELEVLLPEDALYTHDITDLKLITNLFELIRSIAKHKLTDAQLGLYSALILFNHCRPNLKGVQDVEKIYGIVLEDFMAGVDIKIAERLIAKIPMLEDATHMHMESLARFKMSQTKISFPALHKEIFNLDVHCWPADWRPSYSR